MNQYKNALAVYANRPLLKWSAAILLLLAILAIATSGNKENYSVIAMVVLIVIMGVQVTGYLGVTAIQLIWNDRARLMPGTRRVHWPVLAALLLALFGFVVVTAALAKQNTTGMAAIAAEIMAVGLWLVTTRKWWMVPAAFYFVILGTNRWQVDHSVHIGVLATFDHQMIAISAAAIAAWLCKLFLLGGEPIDFGADFLVRSDSRLIDFVRRVLDIGPMWLFACIPWRRGSMPWRIARWWAGAGDTFMVLFLLIPIYLFAVTPIPTIDAFFKASDLSILFPAVVMTVLTAVPLVLGMSMIMSRASVIAMQAVWPVSRRQMLAENLAIVVAEVSGLWLLTVLPLLNRAHPGDQTLDWPTTMLCVAGSGVMLWLIMGILAGLERHSSELRGLVIVVIAICIEKGIARWLVNMPRAGAIGCLSLMALVTLFIWFDAAKRWLRADLTRAPGEGKTLNV